MLTLLQPKHQTNMDNNNQMQSQSPISTPNPSVTIPTAAQTQSTSPVSATNNTVENKKGGVGSVIATIIIIAVIILGGLYFWGKRIETQRQQQALLQNTGTVTEDSAAVIEATKIETVSQDDSVNTIESELNTTNTANLSPELQ